MPDIIADMWAKAGAAFRRHANPSAVAVVNETVRGLVAERDRTNDECAASNLECVAILDEINAALGENDNTLGLSRGDAIRRIQSARDAARAQLTAIRSLCANVDATKTVPVWQILEIIDE